VPVALAALTNGGHTATIRGMIWHQGESDGSNTEYADDLAALSPRFAPLLASPISRSHRGTRARSAAAGTDGGAGGDGGRGGGGPVRPAGVVDGF
jgi:hypothetical protein